MSNLRRDSEFKSFVRYYVVKCYYDYEKYIACLNVRFQSPRTHVSRGCRYTCDVSLELDSLLLVYSAHSSDTRYVY